MRKFIGGGGIFRATGGRELWYSDSGSNGGVILTTYKPTSSNSTPVTDWRGSTNDRGSSNSVIRLDFAGKRRRIIGILHYLCNQWFIFL